MSLRFMHRCPRIMSELCLCLCLCDISLRAHSFLAFFLLLSNPHRQTHKPLNPQNPETPEPSNALPTHPPCCKRYPFKPPSIMMITPNGRFKTSTRLCLSMSDYHPDQWNPTWSTELILKGQCTHRGNRHSLRNLGVELHIVPTRMNVDRVCVCVACVASQRLLRTSMLCAHRKRDKTTAHELPPLSFCCF